MRKHYALLAATFGIYVVTMYLRCTIASNIAPWEIAFLLWVGAHDIMAATAGYQLGNIRALRSMRKVVKSLPGRDA